MNLIKRLATALGVLFAVVGAFAHADAKHRPTEGAVRANLSQPQKGAIEGAVKADLSGKDASSHTVEAAEHHPIGAEGQRTESKGFRNASSLMRIWEVESKDDGGTLLFSDSPEYVTQDGILYQDIVSGDARILYYHLNEQHQDKKVAVVVEALSDGVTTLHVTRGGMSRPSKDYLKVGKETQIAYFGKQVEDGTDQKQYMTKGSRRLISDLMHQTVLKPGELVYGVFDFHADQPLKLSVIMYPATANPYRFADYAKILPADEHRLRGTFRGMNRTITSKRSYNPSKDGIVYFPLADNERDLYRDGIDATDGSKVTNYGNYGVLYKIDIPMTGRSSTRYLLSPLGGVYAGAMRAVTRKDEQLIFTPDGKPFFGHETVPETESVAQARRDGIAFLTRATEIADLGTYRDGIAPSFEFSPPGASNLPVNFIMMPAEDERNNRIK